VYGLRAARHRAGHRRLVATHRTRHVTPSHMRICSHCSKHIRTHVWVVGPADYCSPWCHREHHQLRDGGHVLKRDRRKKPSAVTIPAA
jgi:hypothetical protein